MSEDRVLRAPRPSVAAASKSASGSSPGRAVLGFGTWAGLFYLFIEYFRPQFYFSPLNHVKPGMFAFAFGLGFLVLARKHRLPREAWLLLLFLFMLFKTVPFSSAPRVALTTSQNLLVMAVAGPLVMMTALDTVRKLRISVWFYVILVSVLCVQGIRHGGRGVAGFFTDENDLAMALCTAIPLGYFLAASASSVMERVAGYFIFGLNVLGVMMTFSRGGFLGLIALILHIILNSRQRVRAITVLVVAVVVLFPFVPPGWYQEMQSIETANQPGETGDQRLYMWGVAWRVFLDHAINGVGPNVYIRVSMDYEDPDRAAGGLHLWGKACHSVFFTGLAEWGLSGMLVWLALLAAVFYRTGVVTRRMKARLASSKPGKAGGPPAEARALLGLAKGLQGAMVGFLVPAAFITVNYYPNFWTLIGLMAAVPLAMEHDPALRIEPAFAPLTKGPA